MHDHRVSLYRGMAGAALTCLLLASTAGCGSSSAPSNRKGASAQVGTSASAASSKVFDPRAALAKADKAPPYSVAFKARTDLHGISAVTMWGRFNFKAALTGRMFLYANEGGPKDSPISMETVGTADGWFTRDLLNRSGWIKVPQPGDTPMVDYGDYAKLLLDLGPSARKGMEEHEGTPVFRLSGRIDVDKLRTIDPSVYNSMRSSGVRFFECDQWIDSGGRTLRFEQWFKSDGSRAHNVVTFSDFGPPESFANPSTGG